VLHVPSAIRNRDRIIGTREPILKSYVRITFKKELVSVQSKPFAAIVCPGHPLLDATNVTITKMKSFTDSICRSSLYCPWLF
jgi:hypothetical protein